MGSGKGQVRRASGLQPKLRVRDAVGATRSAASDVVYDEARWDEFVQSIDLESTTLYEYY